MHKVVTVSDFIARKEGNMRSEVKFLDRVSCFEHRRK